MQPVIAHLPHRPQSAHHETLFGRPLRNSAGYAFAGINNVAWIKRLVIAVSGENKWSSSTFTWNELLKSVHLFVCKRVVDRIGSLSRRVLQPLEAIWPWVPGTFEEHMARKVQERMDMIKVVLGAGELLAASFEEQQSIDDLERYRLDFAP